jgi:hypothetical protein
VGFREAIRPVDWKMSIMLHSTVQGEMVDIGNSLDNCPDSEQALG